MGHLLIIPQGAFVRRRSKRNRIVAKEIQCAPLRRARNCECTLTIGMWFRPHRPLHAPLNPATALGDTKKFWQDRSAKCRSAAVAGSGAAFDDQAQGAQLPSRRRAWNPRLLPDWTVDPSRVAPVAGKAPHAALGNRARRPERPSQAGALRPDRSSSPWRACGRW